MNNNKTKSIIDHYSTAIYPVDLYVSKNSNYKELSKIFDDITEKDVEDTDNWATTIFGAKLKGTDDNVCLIILHDKTLKSKDKPEVIDTLSHEALHYVIDLMEYIGQPLVRQASESLCYLQGWATKCIYKTLVKK